jgi:LAO/AO transport system kinase
VFVVNKADRDGAAQTVRDLRYMVSLGGDDAGRGWKRPIVRTVAARGEGIDELVAAIDDHRCWLDRSGERTRRRTRRAESEVQAVALEQLRERIGDIGGAATLPRLAAKVARGESDPYRAADELIEALGTA